MTVEFDLDGHRFVGINGGPQFQFDEVSFQITCETQDEVDYYWERLTDGGEESFSAAGSLDRYGLSWQVVPTGMEEVFSDPDPERAKRAMAAMLEMRKLDIEALRSAADGAAAV